MIRLSRAKLAPWCLAAVCTLAPGCGRVTRLPTALRPEEGQARVVGAWTATGADMAQGFYPLAIGNRWVYSGSSYKRRVVPGRDSLTTRTSWTREESITGRTMRGGLEYFRVESSQAQDTVVVRSLTFLRQDRGGLYESAVMIPGQTSPERTVLQYPLHAGASWEWSLGIMARVEGREVVETPDGRSPAWRIRLYYEGTAASTITRMWIGACGLVGTVSTTHREYVDRDGQRIVSDAESREWLSSVQLVQAVPQILGVATISSGQSFHGSAQRIRPRLCYSDSPAALFDESWIDTTQVGTVLVATAESDADFAAIASRLTNGISEELFIGACAEISCGLTGATEARLFSLASPDFGPARIRRIVLRVDDLSFSTDTRGGPVVRFTYTITVEGTRARDYSRSGQQDLP